MSNLHLALMLLIDLFSFLSGHNTIFLQFPNIGLIFSKIFHTILYFKEKEQSRAIA